MPESEGNQGIIIPRSQRTVAEVNAVMEALYPEQEWTSQLETLLLV